MSLGVLTGCIAFGAIGQIHVLSLYMFATALALPFSTLQGEQSVLVRRLRQELDE